jgi:hypothetical protein
MRQRPDGSCPASVIQDVPARVSRSSTARHAIERPDPPAASRDEAGRLGWSRPGVGHPSVRVWRSPLNRYLPGKTFTRGPLCQASGAGGPVLVPNSSPGEIPAAKRAAARPNGLPVKILPNSTPVPFLPRGNRVDKPPPRRGQPRPALWTTRHGTWTQQGRAWKPPNHHILRSLARSDHYILCLGLDARPLDA